MSKLNFEHEGAKFTVKGEWDGDTYTAQAFKGKKEASDPFSVTRDKKDKNPASDEALQNAVLTAAKDDVISGNGVSESA